MEAAANGPRAALARGLATGRIHSAYLLSGPGEAPREAALWFVRGLACEAREGERPCETCRSCRLSTGREEIALDGAGKSGPLLRHVGDQPDLFWIERGAGDTRVRIGQVRALQAALRLRRSSGEARRAAVTADAEWRNAEAQNALLRRLEEPPPETEVASSRSSAVWKAAAEPSWPNAAYVWWKPSCLSSSIMSEATDTAVVCRRPASTLRCPT